MAVRDGTKAGTAPKPPFLGGARQSSLFPSRSTGEWGWSMPEPVTLVCGFGRCGSSLMMQMLAAGGMPTTARFPAFEDERASPQRAEHNDARWLTTCEGHAVKLLDPHRFDIPPGPGFYCVIWCSRDREEQARSQAKFLKMICGVPTTRRDVKALMKSYIDDKPAAFRSLAAARCGPILEVHFETMLARPHEVADVVAEHCSHRPLDKIAMAAAVRPRSPRCAPGLDMELALISEDENRGLAGA
jgi:hypothetical protein